MVARAEESQFNTYNFQLWRDIYLFAGAQITILVKGSNSGADTWRLGVEG